MLGYVAALAEQGPTRGPQNVFVNRRIVKDRTIAHAIIDAYSVASIKERSPEVHLFIEMPRDAVDVNVHPTKAEVRFRDQSYMHQVIRRALGDALGRGPAPELHLDAPRAGRAAAVHAAAARQLRHDVPEPLGRRRAAGRQGDPAPGDADWRDGLATMLDGRPGRQPSRWPASREAARRRRRARLATPTTRRTSSVR